jgi:hypothetical protein
MFIEWGSFNPKAITKEFILLRWVNNVPKPIQIITDFNLTQSTDIFRFEPNNKICYSFTSRDLCGIYGDTSKVACLQGLDNPAPNLLIYTATVVDDKEIKLVWQQAEADSFWRYQIWKKEGRFSNKFKLIEELKNVSDTVYSDKDVLVDDASYCYKIVNVDLCGNESVLNKEACSILLTGTAEPFINKAYWLPYDYWEQGINRYDLLKTEPMLYSNELFTSKTSQR